MKARFFLLTGFTALAWLTTTTIAAETRRVISLDGIWEVAEGGMDRRPDQFAHRVPVPGLMDMAEPPFEEVGVKSERRQAFWYRRTFKVEGEMPAVAQLKLHKAMYGTRVWLNSKDVGEHAPCFTPGVFNVHDQLRGQGHENELVVRVGATREALPESIPTGHDFEKKFYVPGIYDSVELILTGSPQIVRVQAVPDLEAKAVRVQVWVRKGDDTVVPVSPYATLHCTVREVRSGRKVGAAEIPVKFSDGADETDYVNVLINDCHLWSPEDPFLYELEVTTPGDSLRTRFGMRSFSFDKATGRAMLNGRPYYLRGTNVCIFRFFEDAAHGDKAWREDWVRKLHRAFRDMHWNSIRYCIGFPPELWYRIADEEGLLIQDEFPIWHGAKWPAELKSDQLIREYTEWMQERWNHPCVVIWDAQNETITEETGKAIHAVRGLDLSDRPWDNGYGKPDAPGDSYESHPYVFNNPTFRLSNLPGLSPKHLGNARPNDTGNAMIINEYSWLWLNRDGTPTTLTEKLYENLLGKDATNAERQRVYGRYEAALTEYWRAQRRFAGVLHFCGLTYSRPKGQTCDNFVDLETLRWEPNFYKYVRDSFSPLGLMIDEWAEELPGGQTREIPVVVLNDLYDDFQGEVTLRVLASDKTVSETTQPCKVSALGRERLTFAVAIPAAASKYQLEAELRVTQPVAAGASAGRRPPRRAVAADPVRSLRDFAVLSPEEREARRNLAEGRPVTASSSVTVGDESYPASYAVDGNASTRWSSEFSDPQWIAVDLGQAMQISRVELLWEHAAARAYTIQVSLDGQTWTDVFKNDRGRDGRAEIRFAPVQARWVRLHGTRRTTEFGYSLWEFRVLQ